MLAAVGLCVARPRSAGAPGCAVIVTGYVVFSLGLAPVFTLTTDLIVGAAPPERAGAASAISETSAEFGGALGIAILGSIGTAVYRSAMADAVPAGVPPEAAEAAASTLGGAVAVAEQLPGQLGAALLDAAREAFTQALQLTAVISAVVAIGLAFLAALMPRGAGSAAPASRKRARNLPARAHRPDMTTRASSSTGRSSKTSIRRAMKQLTIRSGSANIAAEIAGKGPPVALLHAGVADRRMWGRQVVAFGAQVHGGRVRPARVRRTRTCGPR